MRCWLRVAGLGQIGARGRLAGDKIVGGLRLTVEGMMHARQSEQNDRIQKGRTVEWFVKQSWY